VTDCSPGCGEEVPCKIIFEMLNCCLSSHGRGGVDRIELCFRVYRQSRCGEKSRK
jgi:hypothetical protein